MFVCTKLMFGKLFTIGSATGIEPDLVDENHLS